MLNAASTTSSSKELNDVLAGRKNRLNDLLKVLLGYILKPQHLITDVRLAYNHVWLRPEDWKYQWMLWRPGFD